MPRKKKNVKVAKTKDVVIPQSETTIVTPVKRIPDKHDELEFLGEWLAKEYLSIELNYDPLEEHHITRNNKLQACDGKDPNGRTVEVRTKKRSNTNFLLTKEDLEAFSKAERGIICEYGDSNTIGMWEILDRDVVEKNKQIRLPIKQLQLLLSFDNQEFAEKMRAQG